jgi:RNA-directed DNA polymerase
MHESVASVGEWLRSVTLGYYQYHAVPGNIDRLNIFAERLRLLWRKILIRRSQRSRVIWNRIAPIFDHWIPAPRVLHPIRVNASPPHIQGGSRMHKRARTVLCGGGQQ